MNDVLKLMKPRDLLTLTHGMMMTHKFLDPAQDSGHVAATMVLLDFLDFVVDAVAQGDADSQKLFELYIAFCNAKEVYLMDTDERQLCWKYRSNRYRLIKTLTEELVQHNSFEVQP